MTQEESNALSVLDARIAVYRRKQEKADPFAEDTYNRHDAMGLVIEALEIVRAALESGG